MNRVIFTGSREFPTTAAHLVMDVLLDNCEPPDIIVHGDAKGLDSVVDVLAKGFMFDVEPHPANWRPNGKLDLGAGAARNLEMAKLGARLCIGFLVDGLPCKGTRGMIGLAKRHKIPCLVYTLTVTGDLFRLEAMCDL